MSASVFQENLSDIRYYSIVVCRIRSVFFGVWISGQWDTTLGRAVQSPIDWRQYDRVKAAYYCTSALNLPSKQRVFVHVDALSV